MLAEIEVSSEKSGAIQVLGRPGATRQLETEVILKLVEVGGETLTALIAGLSAWLVAHRGKTIVIQDQYGNRIEAPAGVSDADLDNCRRVLERMQSPTIRLE
ncbi:hypothetical protein [Pararhodospirillum photometricum]|uniref:hypothetical protein n=1 Tax=Pararhodospirillum photometricum TaxID=1084 RepID=UPI0005A1A745|nr:hypothetical protein [Pararhodospirillum photometricum]